MLKKLEKNSGKTKGKDQLDDVYLIRSGNTSCYKIGFSNNFSERLSRLQTGNPEKLEMIKTCFGGKKLEKSFHEKYADCRISGEWFNFDQRTLKSVIEDYDDNKYKNTIKMSDLVVNPEEKISTTQKTSGNYLEDQTIIPVKRGFLEGFHFREDNFPLNKDNVKEAFRIFRTSVPNNGIFSYLSHNGEFITLKRNSPSYCQKCQQIHDKENMYLFVDKTNGYVHYTCDIMNPESKKNYLGELLVPEKRLEPVAIDLSKRLTKPVSNQSEIIKIHLSKRLTKMKTPMLSSFVFTS